MVFPFHISHKLLRKTGAVMCSMSYAGMVFSPLEAIANNSAHNPPIACNKIAIVMPKPVNESAWHTIHYDLSRNSAQPKPLKYKTPATVTLLDEIGQPAKMISAADEQTWQEEADNHTATPLTLLHLGEALFGIEQHPEAALPIFKQVFAETSRTSPIHGVAAWDGALARYKFGAYASSASAFQNLQHCNFVGVSHRSASLMERRAASCAGYHDEHTAFGIPEPPRLDPLCGVAALAVWLRAHHKNYSEHSLLKTCRVTGEGSTLGDVLSAAKKLGLDAKAVTADETGLKELPKPAIAYVEHDHFIAVTRADKKGVTYICADCGPWPGGAVHLTWKQWRMLSPGLYGVFTTPGSLSDDEMASVGNNKVQLASTSMIAGLNMPVNLFGLHVKLYLAPVGGLGCGGKFEGQKCGQYVCCPKYTPSPSKNGPLNADPVNLATGEEEYGQVTDLSVYNPIGPSVSWSRIYDSLRAPRFNGTYEFTDYGVGWSQNYNIAVLAQVAGTISPATGVKSNTTPIGGTTSTTLYLIYPNGSRVQITPTSSNLPSATHPSIPCTVTAGADILAEWDYNSTNGNDYFKITMPNRSKWILTPTDPNYYTATDGAGWYSLTTIEDCVGNSISLKYNSSYGDLMPVITEIDDSKGVALLTVQRDAIGDITSISDRYNRSVYYHVGTYNTMNVGQLPSYQELDHVSQVVTTGSANPPDRYVYGYSDVLNGEGNEEVPFLTGITVPSPTGNGTSTATLSYLPYTDYVNTITDANGNVTTFTQVDANHTKVSVANAQGVVAYSYTAGYDNNMSSTTATDGTNQTLLSSVSFNDPNDPYAPSEVEDANGVASGGAKGTWYYSHDQYGNVLVETSPYGTTTTSTYNYTNFALGELIQTQTGNKTPLSYTYYEPSGLVKTKSVPLPGTMGSGQTVTTSYTYTTLGNLLTIVSPGNQASPTINSTFGYTQDGSYSQPEALDEPIIEIDNLNHITHLRYDERNNTISSIDAAGIETDYKYDIADDTLATIYPATEQTGTGRSESTSIYLYPDGPKMTMDMYDESANLQRQINNIYGNEGELLGETGSTEPYTHIYDADYRTISTIDGDGHTTNYAYNIAGHLASITYPDGKQIQYLSYDPDGKLLKRIDARGIETDYSYNDPESQITSIQYPASPAFDDGMTYDEYGRIVTLTDSTGSRSNIYDDNDSLISTDITYTGLPAQSISYTYNADGTRDTMGTPAGVFSYTYDGAERPTSVTNPFNEIFSCGYSVNDWQTSQNSDGIIDTKYSLDPLCRVTSITNTLVSNSATLSSFGNAGYDAVDNLTATTSNIPSVPTFSGQSSYQYDTLNQLTQEQSTIQGGFTNAFQYDIAGNALLFKGTLNNFNINNQNTVNTYDPNGNPIVYKGVNCSWDAENQLISVGSILSAGYNAYGLRAWKQTSAGRTYFLYDGDFPICELNSSGTVTATNTCGSIGLVARHTSAGSIFYTFDLTGNVAQRINSNGQVISTDAFNAYGTRSSTDNNTDPFGYKGQSGYYTDMETGLIYLGHRYYDPQSGTFLNRDPIGFAGGVNTYCYVTNNPVTGTDGSGFNNEATGSRGGRWHEGGTPNYPDGEVHPCKYYGPQSCPTMIANLELLERALAAHLDYPNRSGAQINKGHYDSIQRITNMINTCERKIGRFCKNNTSEPSPETESCPDPAAQGSPGTSPFAGWDPLPSDPPPLDPGVVAGGVVIIIAGVACLCIPGCPEIVVGGAVEGGATGALAF